MLCVAPSPAGSDSNAAATAQIAAVRASDRTAAPNPALVVFMAMILLPRRACHNRVTPIPTPQCLSATRSSICHTQVQHPVALDDDVGIFEQVLAFDAGEVALARPENNRHHVHRHLVPESGREDLAGDFPGGRPGRAVRYDAPPSFRQAVLAIRSPGVRADRAGDGERRRRPSVAGTDRPGAQLCRGCGSPVHYEVLPPHRLPNCAICTTGAFASRATSR